MCCWDWTLGSVHVRQALCQLNYIPCSSNCPNFNYSKGWEITWASGLWVGLYMVSKEADAAAWTRSSLLGSSCPHLTLPKLPNSSKAQAVTAMQNTYQRWPLDPTSKQEEVNSDTNITAAFQHFTEYLLNPQPPWQPPSLLGELGQLVNKKLMEFLKSLWIQRAITRLRQNTRFLEIGIPPPSKSLN